MNLKILKVETLPTIFHLYFVLLLFLSQRNLLLVTTSAELLVSIWPQPQVIRSSFAKGPDQSPSPPQQQQQQSPEKRYLSISNLAEIQFVASRQCEVIRAAIARFRDRAFTQDCARLNSESVQKLLDYRVIDFAADPNRIAELRRVVINFKGHCERYPSENSTESYEIDVRLNGIIEIVADSQWATIRALDSLAQIIENVGRDQFRVPLIYVRDSPRFAFRGLMLDTGRHFLSVRSILAVLDAMEMNKLNVLHWHMVDDQSFPFVSVKFPALSEKGAYNPRTHVYRPADIEAIIEQARLRGIRILVEFDTPGHMKSWRGGIPDLLTRCYATTGKDKNDPVPTNEIGPLNPTLKRTYEFLQHFYSEITARFPDRYLHLGGDEVAQECWQSNPQIRRWLRKTQQNGDDPRRLQAIYMRKLSEIVDRLNRSSIVWQDVFDAGVRLPADRTIFHVWIEKRWGGWRAKMDQITKTGYRVVLSAPWYLEDLTTEGWRKYYETDPLDFDGTPKQKQLVLGGSACMWSEYADSYNLIPKIFPATNALAEKLWSPSHMTKRSVDAESRFNRQICRMTMQAGLRVGPANGPSYCPCDHVA